MADVVLQFLYRVRIWFVYRTFQVFPEKISPLPPGGGLQPSKSLCYIGYTSTWWQHDYWRTVQTLHAIYILTPERISQGHVQNGRRVTFSWPTLYIARWMQEWHNPKIAIWSWYYDWAEICSNYTRQYFLVETYPIRCHLVGSRSCVFQLNHSKKER